VDSATVLSGFRTHPVADLLSTGQIPTHLISIPKHNVDRDFVAVRAVLGLTALATNLALRLGGTHSKVETLAKVVTEIAVDADAQASAIAARIVDLGNWCDRTWVVLTAGAAEPVRLAYQSLFAEAGIANICTFDAKDYTHGNYHSALTASARTLIIVLTDEPSNRLGNLLERRLGPLVPTLHISFSGDDEQVMWAHLLTAVYLVGQMATAKHQSLRHPPKPPAERYWTSWGNL
jgi:hypothetical protein